MQTRRIGLALRYDGTAFHGSQEQAPRMGVDGRRLGAARTVSGTLKTGLEDLVGGLPRLLWAGRTDSGVHALVNFAAFDEPEARWPDVSELARQVNRRLPPDLRLLCAWETKLDWHPRYAARSRTYLYRLWRGSSVPLELMRFAWQYSGDLDLAAARQAAQELIGNHDFSAMSKAGKGTAHGLCQLLEIRLLEAGEELRILIRANRFLRSMARKLVALLIAAAEQRLQGGEISALLAGERIFRFKAAPPQGLALAAVEYAPGVLPGEVVQYADSVFYER